MLVINQENINLLMSTYKILFTFTSLGIRGTIFPRFSSRVKLPNTIHIYYNNQKLNPNGENDDLEDYFNLFQC